MNPRVKFAESIEDGGMKRQHLRIYWSWRLGFLPNMLLAFRRNGPVKYFDCREAQIGCWRNRVSLGCIHRTTSVRESHAWLFSKSWETVVATICSVHATFGEARIVEFLTPSLWLLAEVLRKPCIMTHQGIPEADRRFKQPHWRHLVVINTIFKTALWLVRSKPVGIFDD